MISKNNFYFLMDTSERIYKLNRYLMKKFT